jgi:hypothetical protein
MLVTKGTALTLAGRTQEGLALINAGRTIGESLGAHLVTLRAAMNQAFAMEWISPRTGFEASRSGLALARRVGHRGFVMNALFNSVQTGIHLGEWSWAASALEDFRPHELDGADRGLGSAVVAIFRAVRGEPRQELIQIVRELDSSETAIKLLVVLTEAYDATAEGRYADALEGFAAENWGTTALDNLSWGVHLAAWTRDAETLTAARGALRDAGRHGPSADALTLTADAGLAAMAESRPEALTLYDRALEAWRAVELRFQEALVGIDMATLLDLSFPEVQAAVANSRAILTELGARPFLERLDALTAGGSPVATPSMSDAVPVRETEVATG